MSSSPNAAEDPPYKRADDRYIYRGSESYHCYGAEVRKVRMLVQVSSSSLECGSKNYECIASVLSVFSSIVREFLELFYNLWRTVLAKNKIVLDPALRLQSFRTLENATIGVRGGVECQQQERWRPSSRLF
ncbi:hypothetical protein TNCV_1133691 [Trichonephila clavipes]|nr:hypothetical protein TNCV_1133691 [Trichonephila clavipes]